MRGSYPPGTHFSVGCLGRGFIEGTEEELRQEQAKTSIHPHYLLTTLPQVLVSVKKRTFFNARRSEEGK